VTPADAELPDLHRPVIGAPRGSSVASRFAETTQIAAPVLAVVGVVLALAGLPGVIAAGVFGFGVAAYVGSRFAHRRALRATRFIAEENARVVEMLSDGRLDDAARAMDALLLRARVSPRSHAVILVLRAALFMRTNDVARAKQILVAVQDSKLLGTARTDLWNARVRSALAVVEAAQGDLDAAEAWLEPLGDVESDALTRELVVSRVVIAARRGRYAEVVAVVDRTTSAPVAELGDQQKKTLALMRAFSIDRSAPDGARAGEVESSLRDVGHVDAWEIDYLRSAWPTLTAFCDEHRLGVASTSSGA
jgi:hypothetical protein